MAAQNTADEQGRLTLMQLADEELLHIAFLHKQYKSISESGRIDAEASLGKHPESSSPIFSQNLKTRAKEAHYEMSALSIALQLENSAIIFYTEQAKQTELPEAKHFFTELANWEIGHKRAIEFQLEELKDAYWSENFFSPL
jgi:rubrerythrin